MPGEMPHTHHRGDDIEGSDFSHMRVVRRMNGHQRWINAVITTAIVAALGWFLIADRQGVGRLVTEAHQNSLTNAREIAVLKERLANIQESLARLERNQEKLLDVLQDDSKRRKP